MRRDAFSCLRFLFFLTLCLVMNTQTCFMFSKTMKGENRLYGAARFTSALRLINLTTKKQVLKLTASMGLDRSLSL